MPILPGHVPLFSAKEGLARGVESTAIQAGIWLSDIKAPRQTLSAGYWSPFNVGTGSNVATGVCVCVCAHRYVGPYSPDLVFSGVSLIALHHK